jgi:hypothetical protein
MNASREPLEIGVLLAEIAFERTIVGVHELFEQLADALVEGVGHQTHFAFAEPKVEHDVA